MTCPACDQAEEALSHLFHSQCKGCQARALSRSPEFFDAKNRAVQTSIYRNELKRLQLTHAEVLEAAKRDMLGKR